MNEILFLLAMLGYYSFVMAVIGLAIYGYILVVSELELRKFRSVKKESEKV
jgi:hypothetical protein